MRALHLNGKRVDIALAEPIPIVIAIGDGVRTQRVTHDQWIGAARQFDRREGARDAEQLLECAVQRPLPRPAGDDQGAVDVEQDQTRLRQAASPLTLPARGPLADGSSSKLTRSPSFR
jgi:hypothetical protein